MTPERLARARNRLEDLAGELRTDLAGEDDASAPVQLDTSIGRLSRMDAIQSQQMALALRQRMRNQLLRLENALKTLDQGKYGLCRRCGRAISEERLEVQPDAVVCVPCAEKAGR